MIKLASFALAGVLGATGIAAVQTADACPTVGYGVPGIGVGPVGYFPAHYRPYYYVHDRWHRYERFDRFHHRWY